MKNIFFLLFLGLTTQAFSQFGYGATANYNLYQRYTNPADVGKDSAGSALLNFGIGPKLWVGGEKFSFSAEATANLGLLGFSVGDYKGLGMLAIPIVGHLNFGGLTNMGKEGKFGLVLGGGIQYNRTELYYTNNDFDELGGTRDYFRTIILEGGYGFGMSGFSGYGILRYGWDPNSNANNFSIGLKFDFNIPKLKMITDPASEL